MNLSEKDKQILEHIVRYCGEVRMALLTFGDKIATFEQNPVFRNACSMPVLQIGELAKRLSDDFQQTTADIPWKKIKGMRNLFAHDYHSMNDAMIWKTVTEQVPALHEQLTGILKELSKQQDDDHIDIQR